MVAMYTIMGRQVGSHVVRFYLHTLEKTLERMRELQLGAAERMALQLLSRTSGARKGQSEIMGFVWGYWI